MEIYYQTEKSIPPKELERLFLSHHWESGKYPERLAAALQNYGYVCTAWDDGRLIGLLGALDDGGMTAYIHYLLVFPSYQGRGVGKKLIAYAKAYYRDYLRIVLTAYEDAAVFYETCGFRTAKGIPMEISIM